MHGCVSIGVERGVSAIQGFGDSNRPARREGAAAM